MARLSEVVPNQALATNGVWVRYLPDCFVRVAFEHVNQHPDMEHPYYDGSSPERAIRMLPLPDPESHFSAYDVAHRLLRDWRGMRDVDGRLIPFSATAALALLRSPDHTDLHRFVGHVAMNYRLFVEREVVAQQLLDEQVRHQA